ncbi:MAG: hypothetical protein K5739_02530 [Lachnospiraceae bacterium]|nr:hypothetical protein [Lachnospiraceae bacterium]
MNRKKSITILGGALLAACIFAMPVYASAGAGIALDGSGSTGSSTTGQTGGSGQSSVDASTATDQSSSGQKTETTEKATLESIKNEAKLEITGYGDIKKLKANETKVKQIDEAVKKYNKLIGTAKKNENLKGLSNESSIEDCITAAKEAIDAIASAESDETENDTDKGNQQPTSTSDFIMVGGDWVTPVVSYGNSVNIVLPVVNMSQTNLANVTVTPIVSNSVQEWPFELDTSNYTQTIPDLPGKGNGQNDMDRRRELTWTLRARADALSGYYKLQFNVLYPNGEEVESAVLTTYVKVIGAPGSGNAETEGGALSTPRVIVTGFETNPASVHAGDTFTLTLHLKNTSRRTAVSNMLVNFSAPNEGSDTESSYAAFLPTSGSNSEYISSIGKGETTDLVVELTAKADLSQKPYPLDLNMEYEDDDYTSYTASADVSIPVIQEARFEMGKPEIMPTELAPGSDSNIMFSIYNLGKVTLYNVKVTFEGDSISGGDTFVGKIEAGGTGNVDAMVTGEKATAEGEKIYVVVTYEDEAGKQQSHKEALDLKVIGEGSGQGGEGSLDGAIGEFGNGTFDGEVMEYEGSDEMEVEYEDTATKIKKIAIGGIIVVGSILLIVVIIILVSRAKKKKQEKEDLAALEDLEEIEAGRQNEELSEQEDEEEVYPDDGEAEDESDADWDEEKPEE